MVPGIAHQADDSVRHLPGAESGHRLPRYKGRLLAESEAQAPTKLGLPVGGAITLDVALKVLIVKSANDVAVMIAETVAGSEQAFVTRMNKAAQRLGMTRTNFTNVNGLPDERQVSLARDLAKLPAQSSSSFLSTPISSLPSK